MNISYFNSFIPTHRYTVRYLCAFFVLGYLLFPLPLKAQHCPFDGSYMVVIQLTGANQKPLRIETGELNLQEINNPSPDSCSFSGQLLSLKFLPVKQAFKAHYQTYSSQLQKNCADCTYLGEGYYAVVLTMDERTCMIKKGNDYAYRQRAFEARYTGKYGEKHIRIPSGRIYSLCTNGKWSGIIPIAVPL